MKKALLLISTIGLLSLAGLAKADTLVVNGGFETGDFSGWTTYPAPDFASYFGVDNSNPHSGTYAAYFGASPLAFDGIGQTLQTVANQQYMISFWLDIDSEGDPSNNFQALWNGIVVADITSQTANEGNYMQYTASVIGTGSDSLRLQGFNGASFDYLDDVSVAVATPEPASLLLSGLALLGLPVYVRSRKRS